MRRRDIIKAFAGFSAAWPLSLRAQQAVTPVIGFLSSLSQTQAVPVLASLLRGVAEIGFVEGQNLAVEYRFADGKYDRLSSLAANLIEHPVSVIVASTPSAALAAKTATTIIPIIFVVGVDPVAAGLVTSFNRPGGNATGISLITGPLGQKRVELVRELAPKASVITMLLNPTGPDVAPELRDVQTATQAYGLQLKILNAATPNELDAALSSLVAQRPDALLVGADPFFVLSRRSIIAQVTRLAMPAVYPFREFTDAGGLLSYGTNIARAYREAGVYVGRILRGTKPTDLPVMQPTTFELVINQNAAKALGLEISPKVLAIADEVID